MTINIDEALASGDPDLIEQALAADENPSNDEQDVQTEPDDSKADSAAAEQAADEPDTGDSATSGASGEAGDTPKVIVSKSGKHEIPYDVLEHERQARQEAERRAQEVQQQLQQLEQQLESNKQSLDNVRSRLESKGLDTEEMFADPDAITDKQWQEIEDDYGALGKAVRTLLQRDSQLQQQATQAESQQPSVDPAAIANQAIQETPDLAKWQTDDPDRFSMAVHIDQQLRTDPQWQNKPLTERFAEVVKRTKAAFGDPLNGGEADKKAKDIIDSTEPDLPGSLSDMGGRNAAEDDIEWLSSLDPDSLVAELDKMSDVKRDQVLARLT